ncbi:MAG: fibrobacter succinogenes major paralogous domain-containing protein [Bacteroidales bacterium]|nr:fibrobacter succinogenes major paralogous domain-containing protein [Bacteroidales bacterium]
MRTTIHYFFAFLALSILALSGCKKDDDTNNNNSNTQPTTTIGSSRQGGGVTDIEGNTYRTVIITVSNSKSTQANEQEWMAENLKSTKYANGNSINPQEMAVCNNDSTTVNGLGYLYTWNALMNNTTVEGSQGACPDGWHLPTINEYNTLINALGGASVAGKKMKSTDTTYWDNISLADNSSGFSALGSGWIMSGMVFFYKQATMFWTSTEESAGSESAKLIQLNSNNQGAINMYGGGKDVKQSCRCVKN